MKKSPSGNGPNGAGRDKSGKFTKGNRGGPGNPNGKRAAQLRQAALEAVTAADLRRVIAKLIELAEGGDLQAIKELLDRTCGKGAALRDIPDGHPQTAGKSPVEDGRARLLRIAKNCGIDLDRLVI